MNGLLFLALVWIVSLLVAVRAIVRRLREARRALQRATDTRFRLTVGPVEGREVLMSDCTFHTLMLDAQMGGGSCSWPIYIDRQVVTVHVELAK